MTKSLIIHFVMLFAPQKHMDPDLVLAVIEVESQFNINAIGSSGEVGLMQLHPRYFSNVSDPIQNIITGIQELHDLKMGKCRHTIDKTFVVCYNLGPNKGSRIKHPKLWPYYMEVMRAYGKFRKGEYI